MIWKSFDFFEFQFLRLQKKNIFTCHLKKKCDNLMENYTLRAQIVSVNILIAQKFDLVSSVQSFLSSELFIFKLFLWRCTQTYKLHQPYSIW